MSQRRGVGTLLGLACVAVLLCATGAAAQPPAPPYQIQWPAGWEVSRLAIPSPNGPKVFGGERVRAVRKDKGGSAAVIELSYVPRTDGGWANLDEGLEGMTRGIRNAFQNMGLTVKVDRKAGTLASLEALEATISATGPALDWRQWVAMAYSKDFMYTLSFSGRDADLQKSQAAFEAVRRSLVLH